MAKKIVVPQEAHGIPTKDPQRQSIVPTKDPQGNKLQKYHIRLSPDDYQALKGHFASRGIPVSTGIRSVLKDYLNRQRRG